MRYFLPFCFLFLFLSAHSQEQITLKFISFPSTQEPAEKIRVSIQNNEYLIKNGNTISVNVVPDYTTSLKIECSIPSGPQTFYYLDPKPGHTYEFEVGMKVNGIYIKLLKGEEAKIGELAQRYDSLANNEWDKKLKAEQASDKVDTYQNGVAWEVWSNQEIKLHYYSALLSGIYTRRAYGDNDNTLKGAGYGFSVGSNWMKLKIPEYQAGLSKWNSFNWGLGLDAYMYASSYGKDLTDANYLTFNSMIVGNLGWTWGLGKFDYDVHWKGVALTPKYRPSFVLSYTIPMDNVYTSNDMETKFNAFGVGFDLDFFSFSATTDNLTVDQQTKISIFFLPPIGKCPFFFSIGAGVILWPN